MRATRRRAGLLLITVALVGVGDARQAAPAQDSTRLSAEGRRLERDLRSVVALKTNYGTTYASIDKVFGRRPE